MRLRFAKPADAAAIAHIYRASNQGNELSFMTKLGTRFLCRYYQIVLSVPTSVAICAIAEDGTIMGFASGTLDAKEQLTCLQKNHLRLFWAALPQLIRRPALFRRMTSRGRRDDNAFILTDGARWEYWTWDPRYRATNGALRLHRAWLAVLRALGVTRVGLEINDEDEKLAFLHTSQGAKLVKNYVTPEGLRRRVLEYSLN